MNGNKASIASLVNELNAAVLPPHVDVVIAPPFVYLEEVSRTLKSDFSVSAQNAHLESKGAFTGEVSAEMIKDLEKVPWVILGHSERRDIFHESDEIVGKKVSHALQVGLNVTACIGEHLSEREAGKTFDVLFKQMKSLSESIKDWSRVVIAYEPVWAIGTGKTATSAQAQEVHSHLREWLAKNVSKDVADNTRIVYGGSVNAQNSVDLAKEKDVDGFLVGGASLKGADFLTIINAARQKAGL